MTTLHATPYNQSATGFYFTDADDYQTKAKCHLDSYGNLVEEFEIQFIDGDDAELFKACGINQANLNTWFDSIEFLDEQDKLNLFYLMGVTGNYFLDEALLKLDEPNIYPDRLLDAATELFDECMLPEVPENMGVS